jgi:hypothetical protein
LKDTDRALWLVEKHARSRTDTLTKYAVSPLFTRLFLIELQKPTYPDDGRQQLVFIDQPLISNDVLNRFLNDEKGGKLLAWINYFKPLPDST